MADIEKETAPGSEPEAAEEVLGPPAVAIGGRENVAPFAPEVKPDVTEAHRFFEALGIAGPVTFQTFDDDKDRRRLDLAKIIHATLDEAIPRLLALQKDRAGVFVMVNEGDGRGRTAKNVVRVRALFADIDSARPDALDPVRAFPIRPHVITESSPGRFQVFYIVDGVPREQFTLAQKALISMFESDPKVCDLPRVMRMPGFLHQKGAPFQTRIVETWDGPATAWAEFEKHLRLPEPKAKGRPANVAKTETRHRTFDGQINATALARLADWVPKLFPTARLQSGTGAWRVSSADLGRDLEEDISFHPTEGGYDFGLEKPLTPIDAVMEHKPFPSRGPALRWLRDALGVGGGFQTFDRQIRDITDDAVDALVRRNGTAPSVFMFGNSMARISGGAIDVLDDDKVTHELGRATDWFTMHGRDQIACPPPRGIVNDILALKPEENPLPQLDGISKVPLVRADGSICQDDGYDAASRTYFYGLGGLKLRAVADMPTAEDIAAARQLIVEELLGDFRFVSASDLAAAVASMLTGFARLLIAGPTPPFMFEKPKERTGATLLVTVTAYPLLGSFKTGVTWPSTEEEHAKMLLSMLLPGPRYLMYDNVKGFMKSAAFCTATTTDEYEGRTLGQSKMNFPKVRCVFTLTANNPSMDAEIAKRLICIRIDSKMTNPEERTDFRHPNLKQWVIDHRGDLIWAALTLIRGWVVSGAKKGTATLGMFEQWVAVIGGILDHAGIPGLLGNRRDFLNRAAPDDDALKVFVARWWNAYGNNTVKTATLLKLIDDMQVPFTVSGENDKNRAGSLGRKLQIAVDSPFKFTTDRGLTLGVTLVKAGKEHNTGVWRLMVTEPDTFERPGGAVDPGKVPFDDAQY